MTDLNKLLTPLFLNDLDIKRIIELFFFSYRDFTAGPDRILEKINFIKKKRIFLGIAYSFQKYTKIPINKHDVKLDYIFTEKGII